MKILLCGGESPLGRSLVYRLEQMTFPFVQLDADVLASISVSELENMIKTRQINALVNVQHLPFSGEERRGEMVRQYSRNPEVLAKAAAATGAFLLQLSDCQVFSGQQLAAYRETDQPDAQISYGAMRWAGEQAVIEHCPRHLILRTGELFSSLGPNVLTNLLDAWRATGSASVSARYHFCPTAVRDAARVILALLQQLSCGIEPWGIYHYCGTDAVSYRDFARLVKQIIESQPDLDLVMEMQEIAEGLPPLSWTMDCGKIRDTFGIKQHAWRAGLTSGVKRALIVHAEKNTDLHLQDEGEHDVGCD